jgi:hypothetical protein
LFFIPIAGEAAGAASLTTVGNLLRLIGATGEAGMVIHDIVADPQNAFSSIFAYLAGAGAGKKRFRNAAESRRSMSAAEKDRLGSVKLHLDRVESLRGKTCKVNSRMRLASQCSIVVSSGSVDCSKSLVDATLAFQVISTFL